MLRIITGAIAAVALLFGLSTTTIADDRVAMKETQTYVVPADEVRQILVGNTMKAKDFSMFFADDGSIMYQSDFGNRPKTGTYKILKEDGGGYCVTIDWEACFSVHETESGEYLIRKPDGSVRSKFVVMSGRRL